MTASNINFDLFYNELLWCIETIFEINFKNNIEIQTAFPFTSQMIRIIHCNEIFILTPKIFHSKLSLQQQQNIKAKCLVAFIFLIYLVIFLDNQKENIYEILIKQIKFSFKYMNQEVELEFHHIQPKCIGGKNVGANLLPVTRELHFLLHLIRFLNHKQLFDLISAAFIFV